MLFIADVSGKAASLWFAIGWIGASLLSAWEVGGTKRESENESEN
jgi:hypothetical protein